MTGKDGSLSSPLRNPRAAAQPASLSQRPKGSQGTRPSRILQRVAGAKGSSQPSLTASLTTASTAYLPTTAATEKQPEPTAPQREAEGLSKAAQMFAVSGLALRDYAGNVLNAAKAYLRLSPLVGRRHVRAKVPQRGESHP